MELEALFDAVIVKPQEEEESTYGLQNLNTKEKNITLVKKIKFWLGLKNKLMLKVF